MGTRGPAMAAAMRAKNENLVYAELASRGYAVLAVKPDAVEVEWTFVDTVTSKTFTAKVDQRITVVARTPKSAMHFVSA